MILVDMMGVIWRNAYGVFSDDIKALKNGETLSFYNQSNKDKLFKSLVLEIDSLPERFPEYGEIVICLDSPPYWRNDIFPEYKAQRKRQQGKVDTISLHSVLKEFFEKLKTTNIKVLKVNKCEADDLIMILSLHLSNLKVSNLIYSPDKDFFQVHNEYTQQYSPRSNDFLQNDEDLLYFIFRGDSVDNIPCVFCQLEFTDEAKAILESRNIKTTAWDFSNQKLPEEFEGIKIYKRTGMGDVRVRKIIEEKGAKEILKDPELFKRFERNRKLISYKGIPDEIKDKIVEDFKNIKQGNKYIRDVFSIPKQLKDLETLSYEWF